MRVFKLHILTHKYCDKRVECIEEVQSGLVGSLAVQGSPALVQALEGGDKHTVEQLLHGVQQSAAVLALTVGVQDSEVDFLK